MKQTSFRKQLVSAFTGSMITLLKILNFSYSLEFVQRVKTCFSVNVCQIFFLQENLVKETNKSFASPGNNTVRPNPFI